MDIECGIECRIECGVECGIEYGIECGIECGSEYDFCVVQKQILLISYPSRLVPYSVAVSPILFQRFKFFCLLFSFLLVHTGTLVPYWFTITLLIFCLVLSTEHIETMMQLLTAIVKKFPLIVPEKSE